jgi:hypothetical protein
MREAVALEPIAQRGVVLGRGLDLAQRGELRLRGGVFALSRAEGLRRGGAALFGGRVFGLHPVGLFFNRLELAAQPGHARLQFTQRAGVGFGQRLQLGFQALAALLRALLAALEVGEVRLLELQPVFGLGERAARRFEAFLRAAECVLGLRHGRIFEIKSLSRFGDTLLRLARLCGPRMQRLGQVGALLAP